MVLCYEFSLNCDSLDIFRIENCLKILKRYSEHEKQAWKVNVMQKHQEMPHSNGPQTTFNMKYLCNIQP